MAIPDYQTIMLPLLKFMRDQKEHNVREMIDYLAGEFRLSEEEKRRLLPSGNDVMFENKVKWSRLYIGKAGLLESTGRGYWKITKSGLQVLSQNPSRIDCKFLGQFPKYQEWKKTFSKETKEETTGKNEMIEEQTPEEALEYGYQQMRNELAQQLLTQIKNVSSKFFEKLVVELLVKMGYGGSVKDAGEVLGKTGDGGIDGVIKEDKLGLAKIYIQAKKWTDTAVGTAELRNFVGALQEKKANKGVFITTSRFVKNTQEYVDKVGGNIVLIDGERLAQLMIENGVGVSRVANYEVKRVDSDFFVEE
jgi:restriction system protein